MMTSGGLEDSGVGHPGTLAPHAVARSAKMTPSFQSVCGETATLGHTGGGTRLCEEPGSLGSSDHFSNLDGPYCESPEKKWKPTLLQNES